MGVMFEVRGTDSAIYGTKLSIGFTMLVCLEVVRFCIGYTASGYFLPNNLKDERSRVAAFCLLAYAFVVSSILSAMVADTYGDAFVAGMLLAIMTFTAVHAVLFYTNPCCRRAYVLLDIPMAGVVWGIVMMAQMSV